MLEETLGRNERRATSVVVSVLILETVWVFFHKYLPLDSAFWVLQSDLVHEHLSGTLHASSLAQWKLVSIPSANILLPLISGILRWLFSGEIVIRFLHSFIGIFLRGAAILVLFRVLRVRDEAVYYLIPVITFSGIWFSGALPYLAGETVALFAIAYLLTQDRPRSTAYWIIASGFALAAMFHALAFVLCVAVVFFVAQEQRRSIHLSQGWLSSQRAVMGLLLPGAVVLLLTVFVPRPIFSVSSSGFLPGSGIGFLLFMATPVPCVLEAMLRGTNIFQLGIGLGVSLLLLGCIARAFLLAMEEATWQSRALKASAVTLIVIAVAGIWLHPLGVDTPAVIGVSVLLLLGGSYSRGPAVRRTAVDRILLTGALVAMIAAGMFNAFSVNRGSEAASEILKRSRALVLGERIAAHEDEHVDSLSTSLVVDSSLIEDQSSNLISTFSYSLTAPVYLYSETDLLQDPSTFQERCGIVLEQRGRRSSPREPLKLSSPLDYINPHFRILALLPTGAQHSTGFGPYHFILQDPLGGPFTWGEAQFKLEIGKLTDQPLKTLAMAASIQKDFLFAPTVTN